MLANDECSRASSHTFSTHQARYNIVPRFIDEESFWSRYFGQIFYIVQDELSKHDIIVEDEHLA